MRSLRKTFSFLRYQVEEVLTVFAMTLEWLLLVDTSLFDRALEGLSMMAIVLMLVGALYLVVVLV